MPGGGNPNGGGRGFPKGGGGKPPGTTLGSSPGLVTSTGGLYGTNGLLLVPSYNIITGKAFITLIDATNFNCEENSQYTFRQEANYGNIPGEGRSCSIHLIILKYREIGTVSFNINITVFNQITDSFITASIPVNIPIIPYTQMTRVRKNSFPDNRIHTVKLTPPRGVISGERPQVSITITGGKGPLSITKLVMCGNADESSQM
jgi:hypothetical protein